ncbi:MAG: 23S rRNA (adenine(2030)-N(6))-methyltransferase RlmJ [Alphaproteobacteria bacterium]|nr:23S rRNA (adenine(2030)-N(6))-methyltransferase RlmJ [Alphaproteobacteria bacterium]
MNYRHAFHAGNFADVVKHVALVAVVEHLKKKPAPFVVIDSHAGRGSYDLHSAQAELTGEWRGGIGRLGGVSDAPPALAAYLALVRGQGAAAYPGSPLIAARLKRPEDRLVAIEQEPGEAKALHHALAPFRNARAVAGDGYVMLRSLLPPPERRGVVLIDPPWEQADESQAATRALLEAYRRFATGIYLLWFPLKSPGEADALWGEVLAGPARMGLRIDFSIGSPDPSGQLTAAGIVVLNPPYGFAEEMSACLGVLEGLLAGASSPRAQARFIFSAEAKRES